MLVISIHYRFVISRLMIYLQNTTDDYRSIFFSLSLSLLVKYQNARKYDTLIHFMRRQERKKKKKRDNESR